ncbi:sn-glycerol-3-phosphate ABC transporter ATP-binding protein UgpC [Janthinobacterium rivuli]|uniref:ABC transporter ATP-binding protein n=1 Tax=Janthinobacterium sp. FT68W TaxID=2654255 RepID=UPI001264FD1D|nr:sn-glycerol-3-phosphate ABC transporter ATP-binding protein UgpC [Janthinobacterium sp. FT68W]KAB8047582.1 sn-glycerol-3-phosphate ABC transporter ATP-binding protein UgpC [Janthinobacterium sp. FT68W]
MASITLNAVQKSYGDGAAVIRNVDLDIGEHEFCVFLGPSGCGKSTLLRMIAGLEDLSGGELRISGELMNDVPPAERGVAMVFQSYALFPHMSVYDNIGFGLKLAKTPKDELDRRVREAARVLQLDELLERKPRQLSGGQRQRVAIGRAIVRRPGVFLFDEPLSNLDATLRGQTRIEIARLHKQFVDASVVYVTHDQVEAMTLADKIVLLRAGPDVQRLGSIAQVGSPLELYHRPNSRFVAGFIGSPQMNFLPAKVVSCEADAVRVTLEHTGETITVAADGSALQAGQSACVGVRPEHLLLASREGNQEGNRIVRRVMLVERLGEQTYLHFEQPCGDPLLAKAPGNVATEAGAELTLSMLARHCHLFTDDGNAVAASFNSPHLA